MWTLFLPTETTSTVRWKVSFRCLELFLCASINCLKLFRNVTWILFIPWFAEIVRAMTFVINQGMAMYWGTSRWSAMEIMVNADLTPREAHSLSFFVLLHKRWSVTILSPGGVFGGSPVQPDTTCVRAGGVPLFPAGQSGGAAPRALPQDRSAIHGSCRPICIFSLLIEGSFFIIWKAALVPRLQVSEQWPGRHLLVD